MEPTKEKESQKTSDIDEQKDVVEVLPFGRRSYDSLDKLQEETRKLKETISKLEETIKGIN